MRLQYDVTDADFVAVENVSVLKSLINGLLNQQYP